MSCMYYFSETAEDAEKELSFRQLVRELFLSRQVLAEYWVLQSIIPQNPFYVKNDE